MQVGEVVTITKSDEHGNDLTTYPGRVTHLDEDVVVVSCPWTLGKTVDVGPFALLPGDHLIEYYYPDAWLNVFRVCDGAGRLKGWYCNVTMPPEIGAGWIRWRDLKLDYVMGAEGDGLIADEDEFEAMQPSDQVRRQAAEALVTLQRWAALRQGPLSQDGCVSTEGGEA